MRHGDALEVWGDPIDHSRSPALHAAAYAVLRLPWSYGRRQVGADDFDRELGGLDPGFRGLSLTYPLKGLAHRAAATRDEAATLTGAVNTLVVGVEGGPRGYNTDVGGLVCDLRTHGFDGIDTARIIGAGATATSALAALAHLGAQRVDVAARRPSAVQPLRALGETLGVEVHAASLDDAEHAPVALTVATLPGDVALSTAVTTAVAHSGGMLYDVVYGTWPTPLAAAFAHAGGTAVNGSGMLVQQALLQVRIFCTGDPSQILTDEPAVLEAMRTAVM